MDNTTNLNISGTIAIPVSAGSYIVLVLSLIGLIENGIVVILLFTRSFLRKRPHVIFTLSLSCSDFLSSFIVLIIIVANFNLALYTRVFCTVTYISSVIFFGTSLIQALLISLERVLAVSASSLYIRAFQGYRKYIIMICACLALSVYAIVLVAPFPATGMYLGCDRDFMYDDQSKFIIAVGTQCVFIPLVIVTIVLYTISAYKIHRRMKQVAALRSVPHPRGARIRVVAVSETCASSINVPSSDGTALVSTTKDNKKGESSMQNPHIEYPSGSRSYKDTNSTDFASVTGEQAQETTILKNETSNVRKLTGALKTVTLVQLCVFVSFVPLSLVRLMVLSGVNVRTLEKRLTILPLLHPVINPMLYVWLIKEFRNALFCKRN